jgi:hypothetical protein
MRWLPLVLAACSTWTQTGSVVRTPCDHLGARPATECGVSGCDGAGVTVQWSTCRVP